jgi:hypothetical protein
MLDASGQPHVVGVPDLVALSKLRPSVRDAAAPRLSSFEVRRRADRQLEMHLEAPDELGFLGRLLSRISALTLLPSELHIPTPWGDAIQDRLVLGGIGNAPPSGRPA